MLPSARRYSVGTPDKFDFAAQWLACTYPYSRFAAPSRVANAELGATVARYTFGVGLSHSLPHAGLSRRFRRLHFPLWSSRWFLPHDNRGWPSVDLACTAPSLQPHYRAFNASTGRSVPVPRGTLPLAVLTAWGPPSRDQRVDITHFDWPTVSRRQVLHFHASACDELTPPLHRTSPGPRAGSSPAEGTPQGVPLS
jgi:hypothetical protein